MNQLLRYYIKSIVSETKFRDFVSVDLAFRAKIDDQSKGIQIGQKFTVEQLGDDCVVLKRQAQPIQQPNIDSYEPTTFIVSYDELENGFDLA